MIYKSTTPTLEISVGGVGSNLVEKVYVTLKQDNYEVTKEFDEVPEDGALKVAFSQTDTLGLKSGIANVQARIKCTDGSVLATDVHRIGVSDVLKDGEIWISL